MLAYQINKVECGAIKIVKMKSLQNEIIYLKKLFFTDTTMKATYM